MQATLRENQQGGRVGSKNTKRQKFHKICSLDLFESSCDDKH